MRERTVLKIGEFARVNQVSIATLRHYDQCGLLKPVALDPDTGYRYYSLPIPHRSAISGRKATRVKGPSRRLRYVNPFERSLQPRGVPPRPPCHLFSSHALWAVPQPPCS